MREAGARVAFLRVECLVRVVIVSYKFTMPPAEKPRALRSRRNGGGIVSSLLLLVLLGAAFSASVRAAEPEDARALLLKGDYDQCIQLTVAAIKDDENAEDWRLLLAQAFMARGRYTNAYSVISTNLERYPWSARLRLLGYDVFRRNGQTEQAKQLLNEIANIARYRSWSLQDAPSLVALGRTAILLNSDPRKVLEQFFDRAKKRDAKYRDAYVASGQLALDKGDFQLAAKAFSEGLRKFPEDAELHYGLAASFAPSDRKEMLDSLENALEYNTNHVPSLLLLADHLIDAEGYDAAGKMLDRAVEVNPLHPEAWAYRAVIAHLRNDAAAEKKARDTALKVWSSNPEVDSLIGRKLSLKYRFAEGAAAQRRALRFDPKFLPAKIQLSQDLLRLGREDEGWALAADVHDLDGYDVNAFNLVTLHETMAKFVTLTNRDFIVRMATNEAAIYGDKVLSLLQRAKDTLCKKYGFDLPEPTVVEIFPNPKDFGVRTFGIPGNPGYLGVCFGSVITANSPASQAGHPANWEAVLWHEFCHVVTLQFTKNKMPRWLSEGISVFEEKQENPSWGQEMNPRYREMILGKDFTPLGELSGAFLAPKTDLHLQFAYYESSLAVEFLVGRFGLDALKKILRDLGEGTEINTAITNRTAPLAELEKDFKAFVTARAEKLAPDLDFEKPKNEALAKLTEEIPAEQQKNFHLLTRQAKKLMREKNWTEAKAPLQKLLKAYPGYFGADNAYEQLAQAHRSLGETNEERVVLSKLAALDADAVETYLRLIELGSAAGDWADVAQNAARFLAVNPLLPQPYASLARASEELGRTNAAIDAGRTLLRLDPPDPVGAHFQLARLLKGQNEPEAKRQLLQALEDAPRFREGHQLLLELKAKEPPAKTNAAPMFPARPKPKVDYE